MGQQLSQFFNRFYQITIKQHINDPIIHSQWMYFLSMFKGDNLQKERIELYLSILANEKRKKRQQKERDNNNKLINAPNNKYRAESKIKLINSGQNEINLSQIKLEKRLSENIKPSYTVLQNKNKNQYQNMTFHNLHVPFEQSIMYHKKYSQEESKSLKSKNNQTLYALPTPKIPNCMTYLKLKCANDITSEIIQNKQKERHTKLSQISRRLIGVFQSNKLRA